MTLLNAYNATPDQVVPGVEFCFVVKLMVGYKTATGRPVYRIYRCPFEGHEVPQGSRINDDLEVAVMKAIFPIMEGARGKADPT